MQIELIDTFTWILFVKSGASNTVFILTNTAFKFLVVCDTYISSAIPFSKQDMTLNIIPEFQVSKGFIENMFNMDSPYPIGCYSISSNRRSGVGVRKTQSTVLFLLKERGIF